MSLDGQRKRKRSVEGASTDTTCSEVELEGDALLANDELSRHYVTDLGLCLCSGFAFGVLLQPGSEDHRGRALLQ